MNYSAAKVYLWKIEAFEKNLKLLDLPSANKYRNGDYDQVISELQQIKDDKLPLDTISTFDSLLRNYMELIGLDLKQFPKTK